MFWDILTREPIVEITKIGGNWRGDGAKDVACWKEAELKANKAGEAVVSDCFLPF